MRSFKQIRPLGTLLLCLAPMLGFCQQTDLNVSLMQTTFLVVGPGKNPGESTLGTAFLLLRPFSVQPDENAGKSQVAAGRMVLVTAAHIFEKVSGEDVLIFLRKKSGEQWVSQPASFKIRRGNKPLWTKLPDTDVAAIYVNWPLPAPDTIEIAALADDEKLAEAGVEPGAQLNVLGYPFGAKSNEAGFPILRAGVIASYPLLPTKNTKTFLLNFRVFKGDSGGPVYYSPSVPRGKHSICCPAQFIMGLVSQEASVNRRYSQLDLSLGKVVHAGAIKATIESLPAPETADEVNVELTPPQVAPR
jgi:hypothetical protein